MGLGIHIPGGATLHIALIVTNREMVKLKQYRMEEKWRGVILSEGSIRSGFSDHMQWCFVAREL